MTVCYISTYQIKYIRTRVLLSALDQSNQVNNTIVVASDLAKPLNYLVVFLKLIMVRLQERPDVYMLGFRGQEFFFFARLATIGKPFIYDEFFNMYSWFVDERKTFKPKSVFAKLVKVYNKLTLYLSTVVLTDTLLHAKYSSNLHQLDRSKFFRIYVGCDESVFKSKSPNGAPINKKLQVFFYGKMLKLHGVDILLKATSKLEDVVDLTIIGNSKHRLIGGKTVEDYIAQEQPKNVTYHSWVEFNLLPGYIDKADVCIGGPLGDTAQASRVITGKTYQFLAMEKPTVIGKISEPNLPFRDKKNCFYIKQGSVDELVESLSWAANNRDKLIQIGERGRRAYLELAGEDKVCQQLNAALIYATKSK